MPLPNSHRISRTVQSLNCDGEVPAERAGWYIRRCPRFTLKAEQRVARLYASLVRGTECCPNRDFC